MSEATDASASSGTLPDAPIRAASGDPAVPDILAVADRVLSLERQRAAQIPENDEALEWHEVIELKAFSERKVWIEEKTKVRPVPVALRMEHLLSNVLVPRTTPSHRGLHRTRCSPAVGGGGAWTPHARAAEAVDGGARQNREGNRGLRLW